jgi:hypothetical protein
VTKLFRYTGSKQFSIYVVARRALALPDEAIPCYEGTASAKKRAPRSDMFIRELL